MTKQNRKYYQGRFVPQFPKKYKGDHTNIIFRSSWEMKVMRWLDTNSNVLEWSSEECVIGYFDPVQGKNRRYFPDFIIRVKMPDNSIKTYMLEVKPKSQTEAPKRRKKTKRYINEVAAWGTNEAKWEKAREYCADRGWEFLLITEKEIFGHT
jgi:TnsA endonuclease N terminal